MKHKNACRAAIFLLSVFLTGQSQAIEDPCIPAEAQKSPQPNEEAEKKAQGKGLPDPGAYKISVRSANAYFDDLGKLDNIWLLMIIKGPDTGFVKFTEATLDEARADDGTPLQQISNDRPRTRGGGIPGLISSKSYAVETYVHVRLKVPDDLPVTVIRRLRGTIKLSMPEKDPAFVITQRFSKDSDVTVRNDVLKAAKIEITLQKPIVHEVTNAPGDITRSWQFGFVAKDPDARLIACDIIDIRGEPLRHASGITGPGIYGLHEDVRLLPHPSFVIFNTKPPDDVFMKFYVFDEKTVMEIPFEVHDIPLMYSFARSTPEKPPVSEVIYTRRDALRLKFMIEKLGLDAAQRAEIEEIQKLSRLEMSRLLSRFQWNESTYLKWSEGKAAAIDAVLNPDQRKTLKSLDPFATAPRVEPSGPLNVHSEPAKPRRGLGGLEKP